MTKKTPETQSYICEQISIGRSLRSICEENGMPDKCNVFRWLEKDAEFRDQYTRARKAQADTFFDEIIDISDNSSNDYMLRTGKDQETPGWVENGETINRTRIRIDARKWMAGKLRPKKYGERLQQDTTLSVDGSVAELMGRIDGKSRKLPES